MATRTYAAGVTLSATVSDDGSVVLELDVLDALDEMAESGRSDTDIPEPMPDVDIEAVRVALNRIADRGVIE
ncbi:hypothetical protein [Isoptericola croceus]|uniref:hypothetical protein n=1 Tax=Isoptericola croceus TaxID=3031406 RepID=UPI0023F86738|nr:hypothetical protein [Isoptericola croceus]